MTFTPAQNKTFVAMGGGGAAHLLLALLPKPPNTALQVPDATLPPMPSDVRAPPPPTNESYPLAVFL